MIFLPRYPLLIAAATLMVGCMNPYRANFNSTRDRHPKWMEGRLAPPATTPRLILSENIKNDNWGLFEKGYVMVGFSKFDGPQADGAAALAQARAVGADVVMLEKKYARSLTETVTVTQWAPSETTEIRESADVRGPRGDLRTVDRQTEVTTTRGPETVYVPKQVDYYEHSATFWRKLQRPVFGAFVVDLTDELKQRLETNHGLTIRALVTDGPAYKADLLKGDILLTMDGELVPGAQTFYEQLMTHAGKSVEFSVLRGEKKLKRVVALNP